MGPRGAVVFVVAAGWLFGQQESRESTKYVYDGMGNRAVATRSSSTRTGTGAQSSERIESVNGREIPRETVEERVLSEGDGAKITERVVRRYDADGLPGPPEKIRIEESKSPDGSISTVTSVYRSDLSGNYQLSEKATEQISKSGNVTTVERSVEKPTINASFGVVEKSSRTTTETDGSSHSESVTYRRETGGSFYAAAQEVADWKETKGAESETVTVFEGAPGGKMRFSRQTVTDARIAADGSVHAVTDVYNVVVPGQVSSEEATPQLRERQIFDRKAGPGGEVVETVSVRRPSLADPDRLGEAHRISEVTCHGCELKKKP
ncbi:MAG: hypothetical protein LLG20_26865 [Acidobacteriales bacterium]|nr:hypothetical protein [Terriglobales bacterium]